MVKKHMFFGDGLLSKICKLGVYNSDFAFADQSHSEKEKVLVWHVRLEEMSS